MGQSVLLPRILQGPWKEVLKKATAIAPEQDVRLELLPAAENPIAPNEQMLAILREIEESQNDRPYTSSVDSLRLLREARDGGMYGREPTDD